MRLSGSLKQCLSSRSLVQATSSTIWLRGCHSGREVRVRFAPSPTGHLHLGGLRTALYNYLFSRAQKGKFILRIEDTDQSRLVPGAVQQLTEMLQWTGIEIDEGPSQGGSYGPYIQSERLSFYGDHIEKLLKNGSAYRCFCSPRRLDLLRKQTAARGEVPKYDNRCRHLSCSEVEEKLASQLPYVVRFKLESHTEPWHDLVYGPISYDVAKIEGDPVLMKSDGYPTYHLANVVDDHLMNISHVLRGVEWQVSTTKHILLYKAFNWNPPLFAHLPLLQNKDGKKLSKRQNDVHVEHYKNAGYFPEAILNLLTNIGSGFTVRHTAGMDMQQLIEHFDLSKLNTNSTRVDFDKLLDFNRLHLKQVIGSNCIRRDVNLVTELRQIVLEKLNQEFNSFLHILFNSGFCLLVGSASDESILKRNPKNDLIKHLRSSLNDNYLKRVLEWSKDRIHLVSDLLQPQYNFLWSLPTSINLDNVEGTLETAKEMIQETLASITVIGDKEFSHETIAVALNTVGHSKAWKYSQYMKFLRKSLTGCLEGPSVAEIMTILGKETTLNRLHQLLKKSNDNAAASVLK